MVTKIKPRRVNAEQVPEGGDKLGYEDPSLFGWSKVTGEQANWEETDPNKQSFILNKPTIPEVIDNLTTEDDKNALSANMGKTLSDRLDNVEARGRFLSIWNSTTGLPETDPSGTIPYDYKTGDYYIVGEVGENNLRPSGTTYTGAASTTAEPDEVAPDDNYIFDGTTWILQINHGKTVSFANLAGEPTDNAKLADALNNISGTYYLKEGVDYTAVNNATKSTAPWNTSYGSVDITITNPNIKQEVGKLYQFQITDCPGTSTYRNIRVRFGESGEWLGLGANTSVSGQYAKFTKTTSNLFCLKPQYSTATTSPFFASTDNDTTYSAMSASEATTGTSTTARTISAKVLNDKITERLPDVNNGSLIIQKNGTTITPTGGTFTANKATDSTVNITVPVNVTDLADEENYAKKTELANKVDKITQANRVYGTTSAGAQTSYNLTTSATASTVPLRGTDGTINVATPTSDSNAATKKYVDDALQEIQDLKVPNATIVGTPTIVSGNISNFTTTNYLIAPFLSNFSNNPFILHMDFTTGTDVTTQQNIVDSTYGLAFAISGRKFVMALSTNGTGWNIGQFTGTYSVQANTDYHVEIERTGSLITLKYSTTGTSFTTDISTGLTTPLSGKTLYFGGFGATSHPFKGTFNFNERWFKSNGVVVWQGMDSAGLETRANVSLSNLDEEGEAKLTEKLPEVVDAVPTTYTEGKIYFIKKQ